ncbi:MAG: Spy0128 family protein [Eubacterium sp.]|jgi:pilin isopeptide linkage protein
MSARFFVNISKKLLTAALAVLLLLSAYTVFSPLSVDASRQSSSSSIPTRFFVEVKWADGIDPEPVTVTVKNVPIQFTLYANNPADLPESVPIYYNEQYCGAAIKTEAQNYYGDRMRYEGNLNILFHFSADEASKPFFFKATDLTFIGEGFTQATDRWPCFDGWRIDMNSFLNDDGTVKFAPEISESTDSGVIYGYNVEKTADPVETSTGWKHFYSHFIVTITAQPEGTLAIDGQVTENGGTPEKDYTFSLLDEEGQILQTKQNNDEGTFLFDKIKYDASDIGKEYTYQVLEQAGSDENVTYDGTVYTVKVTPYQDPDDYLSMVLDTSITKAEPQQNTDDQIADDQSTDNYVLMAFDTSSAEDGTSVSSIVFNNLVAEPAANEPAQTTATNDTPTDTPTDTPANTPTDTPNTGDAAEPAMWAAILAAAAGLSIKLQKKHQR